MKLSPGVLSITLLFAGCCSQDKGMFVLVPDVNGNIGAITVSNEAGSTTLTQQGETTFIEDPTTQPEASTLTSKEDIRRLFSEALKAEPPQPAIFRFSFKSGSEELTQDMMGVLDQAVQEVSKRDSLDISVNGHTDTTGDANYNMMLSLKRANAIRDMLIERGVNKNHLTTDYHGEGDPRVKTPDGKSEPHNRRVEVIVR